jgi:hypothetical protein
MKRQMGLESGKSSPARNRVGSAFEEEAKRILATEFDRKDPGPSQLVPLVHGVKALNDGLV